MYLTAYEPVFPVFLSVLYPQVSQVPLVNNSIPSIPVTGAPWLHRPPPRGRGWSRSQEKERAGQPQPGRSGRSGRINPEINSTLQSPLSQIFIVSLTITIAVQFVEH